MDSGAEYLDISEGKAGALRPKPTLRKKRYTHVTPIPALTSSVGLIGNSTVPTLNKAAPTIQVPC